MILIVKIEIENYYVCVCVFVLFIFIFILRLTERKKELSSSWFPSFLSYVINILSLVRNKKMRYKDKKIARGREKENKAGVFAGFLHFYCLIAILFHFVSDHKMKAVMSRIKLNLFSLKTVFCMLWVERRHRI